MEQLEQEYDHLEATERAQAELEASQQVPGPLREWFDFSEGWYYTEGVREERKEARRGRGGLVWDALMEENGVDGPATYPPTTPLDLKSLINTLHTLPITRLKRDGFLYYLLLDLSVDAGGKETITGRSKAERFAKKRYLPENWEELMRGYWELDHGLWASAISHLADPSVYPSHIPLILRTLSTLPRPSSLSAKLTTQFITWTKTPLSTPELRDIWVRGLCENDFVAAWSWVRNGGYEEEVEADVLGQEGEGEVQDGEVEKAWEEERERLLEVIMDFCLLPEPRKGPLEKLLTLPIDAPEHAFMTSYLLRPIITLPAASFDLLHDLLTLRLLSQGHHAAAIDLDRRVTELDRQTDQTIFSAAAKRKRKDMVQEIIDVLPEVQRKMLVVESDARESEFEKRGESSSGRGKDKEDLGMSWDMVDDQPRSSTPQLIQPTPTRHIPLSASTALRTSSTPNLAIYQALIQSNPASPVPPRFSPAIGGTPSARASPAPSSLFTSGLPFDAGSPSGHLTASRLASGSSLYRQMAASQMQSHLGGNTFESMERGSSRGGSSFREVSPVRAQPAVREARTPRAVPTASTRRRPLGGWGQAKEASVPGGNEMEEDTPRVRADKVLAEEDEAMEVEPSVPEVIEEEEMDLDHPAIPGAFTTSELNGTKPKAPAKKKPAARKQRQASTQPASPPPPAKKAPARTRKATSEATEDSVMPFLPGSFPKKSNARTAPPSDEEPTPGKKPAKRPRAPPPAPSANSRKTRGQSVASSVASEGGEEMAALRRSSRLSSIAPSSPAESERSELPPVGRSRGGSRQGSVGPGAKKAGGVRTRRQASTMGDDE